MKALAEIRPTLLPGRNANIEPRILQIMRTSGSSSLGKGEAEVFSSGRLNGEECGLLLTHYVSLPQSV